MESTAEQKLAQMIVDQFGDVSDMNYMAVGELVREFMVENTPSLPTVGKHYSVRGLNPHVDVLAVGVAVGPMPGSRREWVFITNPTFMPGGQIVSGARCWDIADVEEVDG
jgi:hypothetical protein